MDKWNNVDNKLPNSANGLAPYLGVCYLENPNDRFEDDPEEEPEILDIVYYYGDNHWKNNHWERVWVKYWMEIPEIPEE